MGNFHCVPSDCATVNYREYLGGKVRWRYGSEPWQEILGADSYTSETGYNLSANTRYKLVTRSAIVSNGLFQGWSNESSGFTSYQFNGIQDWYVHFKKSFRSSNGETSYVYKNGYPPSDTFDYYYGDSLPPAGYRSIVATVWVLSQGTWSGISFPSGVGVWFTRWEPANLALATTQCRFKVFKKGQQVYSETRAVCPQVQVIPCSLSPELKKIEIKKLPYLERVEVRNQSINAFSLVPDGPPLIDVSPLPPECLNVYLTYTLAPPLLSDYVPLPGIINPYQFVAQICSAPGCPPPIYDVICDDCCDKCPDYTCPIECGEDVCCYNDYGVSVQTIPKARYCGGAS